MNRLSEESRYRRFFSPVKELSEKTLAYLTEVDYVDHFAWIAIAMDEPGVVARENGVREFAANVLPENAPMRELLHEHGVRLGFAPQSRVLSGAGPIAERPAGLKNSRYTTACAPRLGDW
jgi:hypothetical protein